MTRPSHPSMTPRERVLAALRHQPTDRTPRFEIWIDALIDELGRGDAVRAYVDQGQDGILMPTISPAGSNAWRSGIDEWGRVWRNGTYTTGVVDTWDDLERYSPGIRNAARFFDADRILAVRRAYPEHCLFYGTHIGPFTMGYLAMGFERFFMRLDDDPAFIHRLLADRTDWCIAMYQRAVSLGADVLVLGEDAGHNQGPMISPAMWREFVLPLHRRIVAAVEAPMIWHSDGNIEPLLPMACEAGFVGIHGLDPVAGMDLAAIKRRFGRRLALIGNVDIRVLFQDDPQPVRREVDRCLDQGDGDGGYLLASCNSIFTGVNAAAVTELFRYEAAAIHSRAGGKKCASPSSTPAA